MWSFALSFTLKYTSLRFSAWNNDIMHIINMNSSLAFPNLLLPVLSGDHRLSINKYIMKLIEL